MRRGVDHSLILCTFFLLSELVKKDQSFEIPGVKFPEVKGIPLVKGKTDAFELFIEFMQRFGRTYKDAVEQAKRFDIFKLNLKLIETLNNNERGTAIYGVTQFADLSRAEFQQMLGLKNSISEENLQRRSPVKTKGKEKTNRWSSKTTTVPASPPKPPPSIPTPPNNKLTPLSAPSAHPGATPQPGQQNPTGFAYTYGDAYPPVKKQTGCGACWAFSLVGAVEVLYAALTKKVLAFSEQQLIDCSDSGDCTGGYFETAAVYLTRERLMMDKDYPYERRKNERCKYNPFLAVMKISADVRKLGGERARTNPALGESEAVNWLHQGPVLAAIHGDFMQHYVDGVMDPAGCKPESPLNHAVLTVGYATGKDPAGNVIDIWVLRNSWGPEFGRQGHFAFIRGKGVCGMGKRLVGVTATLSDIAQ